MQSQSQEGSSQTMRSPGPSKGSSHRKMAFDSDEDLESERKPSPAPVKGKTRAASRGTAPAAEEAPRSTRSSRQTPVSARSKGKKKQQPLFLDDDDDDDSFGVGDAILEEDEDDDEGLATRASGRRTGSGRATRTGSAKPKAPAPILDDDSDDGVTFRGFGTRRK